MSAPDCLIAYGGSSEDCECPDCRDCRAYFHELDRYHEEMGRGE